MKIIKRIEINPREIIELILTIPSGINFLFLLIKENINPISMGIFSKEEARENLSKVLLEALTNKGMKVDPKEIDLALTSIINGQTDSLSISLIEEKSIIDVSEKIGPLSFSEYFLHTLGCHHTGLEMLFSNINQKQVQLYLNKAFTELDEIEQKILSYVYENKRRKEFQKVSKTMKEIAIEFSLEEKKTMKIYGVITKYLGIFADITYRLFIAEIEKNNLQVREIDKEKLMKMELKQIGFSKRTFNCILSADVKNVSNLLQLNNKDLKKLRNFGDSLLEEVSLFKKLYNL